jgi:hypothetical protein
VAPLWAADDRDLLLTRIVKETSSGIRDSALSFSVRQALRRADDCRLAVRAEFKAEAESPATRWSDGDPEVCRTRPTGMAYVEEAAQSLIRVCPAFARGSLRSRVVWVLHEELHTLGIHHGDHAVDGVEMSERIARACFKD